MSKEFKSHSNGNYGVVNEYSKVKSGEPCEHIVLEGVSGDPEYAWRCLGCGKMFTEKEVGFWENEAGEDS